VLHNAYMAHGYCFLWQPPLIALHVISDALVALAYFSIPVLLWYFVHKRTDIPFGPLFVMFGAFIVLCGLTHVMSIVTIWNPVYWADGAIKALTAGASIATALLLVPTIPKALMLRSPAELEHVNAELTAVIAAYEREHNVAQTLQQALLPQALPERAGITFASSYRAATADTEIGGDWFDAFEISAHQIGISCGDVAGHGLPAATLMGATRQMVRTAARKDDDPSAVLGRVNRRLFAEDHGLLVTAFYGVLDTATGRLRYGLAGHPPPLVVDAETGTHYLSGEGLMLGLDPHAAYTKGEINLHPQSTLVLYTDGLVEAGRDLPHGLEQLAATATTVIRTNPPNAAEAIHAAMLGDAPAHDDAAVLTMKLG
jgi:hypothetical protein